MKNPLDFKRAFFGIIIIAALILLAPALTYMGTVFGWTNPPCSPPNCGGAMYVDVSTGNVAVNNPTTASTTLTVNGEISLVTNRLRDVATPIDPRDGVNKAYVDAQTGSGGGSVVMYYKSAPGIAPASYPSCAQLGAGWTQTMAGFGPHYIGLIGYDWYQSGSGGTGGGFGGGPGNPEPPVPPPAPGTSGPPLSGSLSYIVSDIAIGSDSVCSQSQSSVVPGFQFYQNASSGNFKFYSEACFGTGVNQECNLCIVCHK